MSAAVHPPLLLDPDGVAAPLIKQMYGGQSSKGVVMDINDNDLVHKV